jgi:Holliday junction resolvase RusA-like endonuclease
MATSTSRLRVELPLPALKGANSRNHWVVRHRAANADRMTAFIAAQAVPRGEPLDAVRLVIRWHCPTRRLLDCDNALSRCKSYIDGLTDAGWWRDDSVVRCVEISVLPPGEKRGLLEIEASTMPAEPRQGD